MPDWKQYVRQHLPPLGLPGAREGEIVEELAQQLEEAYEEARAAGAKELQAVARAQREVPDWAALAAEIRRAEQPVAGRLPAPDPAKTPGRFRMFHDFGQDVRFGARLIAKSPGFSAVILLTLALAIGANTTIFSVVDAALLEPLAFPHADRIVFVYESNLAKGWDTFSVAPPNFLDWRAQNKVFENLSAIQGISFNYSGGGTPERISGMLVTKGFFIVAGIPPALGRDFTDEEYQKGRDRVVVLGYALWQRAFGGDAGVVGRSVTLNGAPYTVVGVMPAKFRLGSGRTQIWAPEAFSPEEKASRGAHYLRVVGRLKPGVTLEQASAEMSGIAGQLAKQFPNTNHDWGTVVTTLRDDMVGDVKPALLVLLGAVAFVLLIACVNVANMLLSRTTVRRKEIAIRTALGAGRFRLVRQLLTESVLLSLGGGLLGLLVAYAGIRAVGALNTGVLPRSLDIKLNPIVLAFTFGVAVVTGIAFGIFPALAVAREDLSETLKEGERAGSGAGRGRVRGLLVTAEVALALLLLVGSGLFLRSFARLNAVSPGYRTDHTLTFGLELPEDQYQEASKRTALLGQIKERLEALPGVESVGLNSSLPLTGDDEVYSFVAEGTPEKPGQNPSAFYYVVSPGYFRMMGIELLAGREFTPEDAAGTPRVCIINELLAKRFFSGQNPIGKHIAIGRGRGTPIQREIVGVVADVKHYGLGDQPRMQFYESYLQAPDMSHTFLLRTPGDPLALASAVRFAVKDVAPDQPVVDLAAYDDILAQSVALPRFRTVLLGLFAGLAIVLAAVGLYGVMAYLVTQRTREIGIRIALGAQRRDVYRLVVGHGMLLVTIGVAVGLAAALGLTRVLTSFLFGVKPTDPLTFAAVTALLVLVSAAACWLPARRATRVDPLVALRYE